MTSRRLWVGAAVSSVVAADLAAAVWLLVPSAVSAASPPPVVLLAVHVACACAAGALLAHMAPPFVGHVAHEVATFAACLAFFVPVLGPLGVLAIMGWGLTEPRPSSRAPWFSHQTSTDMDERRRRLRVGRRRASAAAIGDILRQRSPESADARFRAVLATRGLTAKMAVPLLRIAQSDPSDEVRLYAFSRLEGMRGEIEKRIERLTGALAGAEKEEAPRLQLRLAESHWELGYSDLTEGAVREHALKSAHQHAALACELLPQHAAAEFFLGKVLVQLRDPSRASIAFDRAARAGYPNKKLLPHLAECAFLQRDYVSVRKLLQQLAASPHVSADFGALIELWTRTESARELTHSTAPRITAQTEQAS